MKKKIVIFGTGEIAEIAYFYFSIDSQYEVTAFTVNSSNKKTDKFCGMPVIEFEKISIEYPPEKYDFFVALGYSNLNALRKQKYLEVKALGYKLVSYISSRASLLNQDQIGENCFIFEDNTIQPFVKIGNNVTLWSGNHIGHHSVINDHVFISSHVVISGGVEIGEQCFIGVNATLRDHIKVGEKCVIGAGALLLSSAEPNGIYKTESTERSRILSSKLKNL